MSVGFFVYILVFSKKNTVQNPALPAKWRKEKARKYKRISVLFSAGSGGRTIKIDVLSSKTHHKLTKERRNNAALFAYAQFVF